MKPYRYGFGDEGGETGRKFGAGSSTHFTATLALTNHPEDLRKYARSFWQARLRLPEAKELSFRRSPDPNRIAFLKSLAEHDLAIHALVIDKRSLPLELHRLNKPDFYAWAFGELITRLSGDLQEAEIILDEFGDTRVTLRALKRRVQQTLPGMRYRQCIRRMRMEKSHRDPLLQIADMLNGAIYRYVREGDERFYRLIAIHTTLWRR